MPFNFNYNLSGKTYSFFSRRSSITLMHSCSYTHNTHTHTHTHTQSTFRKEKIQYVSVALTKPLCWYYLPPMHIWHIEKVGTLLITWGVNRFPGEGATVLTSVWHFGGIRRKKIPVFDWHSAWKAAENCIDFTEAVASLQRLWLDHIMGVYLSRKWHLQAFVQSTQAARVKQRKKC